MNCRLQCWHNNETLPNQSALPLSSLACGLYSTCGQSSCHTKRSIFIEIIYLNNYLLIVKIFNYFYDWLPMMSFIVKYFFHSEQQRFVKQSFCVNLFLPQLYILVVFCMLLVNFVNLVLLSNIQSSGNLFLWADDSLGYCSLKQKDNVFLHLLVILRGCGCS